MGELSLDITNIKRELRLYFIQQLAQDHILVNGELVTLKGEHKTLRLT